jgi:hypothetical protein
VAFQSLQAVIYQLLVGSLTFISYIVAIVKLILVSTNPAYSSILGSTSSLGIFNGYVSIIQFIFILYGVVGAINILMGRSFRYRGIASLVDKA